MQSIQEKHHFKCILCRSAFAPPYNLPCLLPCTHSICTHCLTRFTNTHQSHVLCPIDYERCKVSDLRTNSSTRRAAQRLANQHKTFTQNNQLLCIQSLSKHFENMLEAKSEEKQEFKELLERIIMNQVRRLRTGHERVVQEMEGPLKMVRQWKDMIKEYLDEVRRGKVSREEVSRELEFYIQEGRRIKTDLGGFQKMDFREIGERIAGEPAICLQEEFTLSNYITQRKVPTVQDSLHLHFYHNKNEHPQATNQKASQHKQSPQDCTEFHPLAQSNHNISSSSFHNKSQSNKQNMLQTHLKPLSSPPTTSKVSRQYPNTNFQYETSRKCNVLSELLTNRDPQRMAEPVEGSKQTELDHLLVYSPSKEVTIRPEMETEEILLTEKEDKKEWTHNHRVGQSNRHGRQHDLVPERINFLQEWKVTQYLPSDSIRVEQRQPFSWEKQKNSFIRKMQLLKIEQASSEAICQNGCLELINYCIADMDLSLYLQTLEWDTLEVIKLVKTGLSDSQLNELLNFIFNSKVHTLVLSGNSLGQISLDALLNYTKLNSTLKNVYLSKNNINTLKGHTREKISLLREHGIVLYI